MKADQRSKVNKLPTCTTCGKPIVVRDDLVVVSELRHFPFAAYHNVCYAGQLKRNLWTYGGTRPLNGKLGTLAAGLTAVFALAFATLVFWMYTWTGINTILWPAAILFLWAAMAVGVRFGVYQWYEKPLSAGRE